MEQLKKFAEDIVWVRYAMKGSIALMYKVTELYLNTPAHY